MFDDRKAADQANSKLLLDRAKEDYKNRTDTQKLVDLQQRVKTNLMMIDHLNDVQMRNLTVEKRAEFLKAKEKRLTTLQEEIRELEIKIAGSTE